MIVLGALAAATSVTALALLARRDSTVERRLRSLAPARPRRIAMTTAPLGVVRLAGACAGLLLGCAATLVVPLGIAPVIAAGYLGWIAPSIAEGRRANEAKRGADAATITLVEWLHAIVASGRPLESALATATARTHGSAPLDAALAATLRDYTLGVPLHRALARHGAGVQGLVELASRIERGRDLGRGSLVLLEDLRDELRARERARVLASASEVEGKLTLVLTLCYLPSLALLVIVPLFLTLLTGLFG